MEKLYRGQFAHKLSSEEEKESKIIKTISTILFFVILSIYAIWFVHEWAMMPFVYKSVSQEKVIKVTEANGDPLPLSPLPQKYEIIYMK